MEASLEHLAKKRRAAFDLSLRPLPEAATIKESGRSARDLDHNYPQEELSMRTSATIAGALTLLAIGYALGASQILTPSLLLAQGGRGRSRPAADAQAAQALTDETKAKIKAAADALKSAMEALVVENRYASAIKGVNTFTVLTGGGNSEADLQSNVGVDPETFAGLYAGLASDSIVADLGRDPEGRLTYKGRVIRMYPISVIRSAYARRADITGEELIPVPIDETAKSKPVQKTESPDEGTEENN